VAPRPTGARLRGLEATPFLYRVSASSLGLSESSADLEETGVALLMANLVVALRWHLILSAEAFCRGQLFC
jgi:hypothetical protein